MAHGLGRKLALLHLLDTTVLSGDDHPVMKRANTQPGGKGVICMQELAAHGSASLPPTTTAYRSTVVGTSTMKGSTYVSTEITTAESAALAATESVAAVTPIAEAYALIDSKLDQINDLVALGEIGKGLFGTGKMAFRTLCHLVKRVWALSTDENGKPSREVFADSIEQLFGGPDGAALSVTSAYRYVKAWDNVFAPGLDVSDSRIGQEDIMAAANITPPAKLATNTAAILQAIDQRKAYLARVAGGFVVEDEDVEIPQRDEDGEIVKGPDGKPVIERIDHRYRTRPLSMSEKQEARSEITGTTRGDQAAMPQNRDSATQGPDHDHRKEQWVCLAKCQAAVTLKPDDLGMAAIIRVLDLLFMRQGQETDVLFELTEAVLAATEAKEAATKEAEAVVAAQLHSAANDHSQAVEPGDHTDQANAA